MTETLVPEPPRPVILVVDDLPANRELLAARLAELGYLVREAADGVAALREVERREPDIILLDIDMPKLDGISVCRRLKGDARHRLVPIVLVTALHDRDTRLAGLEAGADDFLTKPFDPQELLVRTRALLRDRSLNLRLDAAENVVLTLARIVEIRDLYTVHHAERVGLYAREIGRTHGFTRQEDLDVLYTGGVLHDIGKIAIPTEILLKTGPLTDEERLFVNLHSAEGERICRPLRSVAHFLPIIRHHHERMDGLGYPDRLRGNDIPIGARIAAVADVWDAMVNDRPYRKALARDEALHRLREAAGTQLDAEFVEIISALIEADRLPAPSGT